MPPRRFGCKDCSSKYGSKSKLYEHQKQHHTTENNAKKKACKFCQKIFTSIVLLKKHEVICENERDISKMIISGEKVNPHEDITSVDESLTNVQNNTKGQLKDKMLNKVQFLLDGKHPPELNDSATSSNSYNMTLSINGVTDDNMSLNLKISKDCTMKNVSESLENVIQDDVKNPGTKQSNIEDPNTKKSNMENPSTKKSNVEDLSTKKSNVEDLSTKKSSLKKTDKSLTDKSVINQDVSPPAKLRKSKQKKYSIDKKGKIHKPKSSKAVKSSENFRKNSSNKLNGKKDKGTTDPLMKTESQPKNEGFSVYKPKDCEANKKENSQNPVEKKPRRFTCAFCNKSFSRKYHLDRHLRLSPCSGLPPMSFPCHVCNRVYTRQDNLREHLRVHTGEVHRKLKHKCQFCEKAFHGQSLLKIHIRKHTGEKPYSCDFCPKKFPSAGALAKHRRTHTGEKPFACPECGQRFSLKGTLSRHLRVHTGIRPHKCLYCGKQFIQIGGLKAHLFYHTGENGFKCEDCGKIFNRKARLEMHKLYVHIKLRPFTCENCGKSFTRKEDLHRHAILHTGEKPFKCPTCDKSFAIKPSLKLHLLTHIKEEPRSCHECGRAFIRKDCLLRHMRKRHRDLLDKILLDEKDEKSGETNAVGSRVLSEEDLCENIQELLSLLVEESTLIGFGWPNKPVDEVLEAVIRRCGHMPVSPGQYSYMDRMRENAKLLFTVVIDDNAVKTLLNNQTVDEVILHVLRLAKT